MSRRLHELFELEVALAVLDNARSYLLGWCATLSEANEPDNLDARFILAELWAAVLDEQEQLLHRVTA